MKIVFSKSKVGFIILFLFYIAASGNFDKSLGEGGLSMKVVTLYSLLFVFFIIDILKRKIQFSSNSKVQRILFLLIAVSLIVVSLIRDGLINTYIYSVILTFIGTLVMIQFLYRLTINKALQLFLVSMLILLVLSLFIHYFVNNGSLKLEFTFLRQKRLVGFLGGGLTGALAGLSAVFSLIYYLEEKRKISLLGIIGTLLSWWTLLLSDNRTSMIACFLIYLFVFLTLSKSGFANKLIFIAAALIISLFIRFYTQNSYRGQAIGDDANIRFGLWSYGIEQINEKPLLGYGKENPFYKRFDALKKYSENLADPHNAYLYFILRNGVVVSFFFFLCIFIFVIFSNNRLRYTNYYVLISIPIYWLIISTTGGDYFNFKLNFSSVIFGISILGFLNHPDLEIKDTAKGESS